MFSRPRSLADIQIRAWGHTYYINRKFIATKSRKISKLLRENLLEGYSICFTDIPSTPTTFEMILQFCTSYQIELSSENTIPIACLAHYLEMTEEQYRNNLLEKTLSFFHKQILLDWNKIITALRSSESCFHEAIKLGLIDKCTSALSAIAMVQPCRLGVPFEEERDEMKTNLSRGLCSDEENEDLNSLSLPLYELTISNMIQCGVPEKNLAVSLYRYAKGRKEKKVIEMVERLLPCKRSILPCTCLFLLLQIANSVQATLDCRLGLELRIGKQLDQAVVQDLFMASGDCPSEYDTEMFGRILSHFYRGYASSDQSGLLAVTDLVGEFLVEMAKDADLGKEKFMSLSKMWVVTAGGIIHYHDALYRAINMYLHIHESMTEMEKDEICEILDWQKLSTEALTHAAQNGKLPLRAVTKVLFAGQILLREAITILSESDEVEWKKEGEDDVMLEKLTMDDGKMETDGSEEAEINGLGRPKGRKSKEKMHFWKALKKAFGCKSGLHETMSTIQVYPRDV